MEVVDAVATVWAPVIARLEDGGVVLAVLLVLSVVAATVIVAKTWQFAHWRVDDRRFVAPVMDAVDAGDAVTAAAVLADQRRAPLARLMALALEPHAGPAHVEREARGVLARLQRHQRLLEMIAQLSPLLGLLGTVVGMIEAFDALQAAGGRADPSLLAGGIAKALTTTAAGLAVAIPASAAHGWFEGRTDRLRQDIEHLVGGLTQRRESAVAA